MKMISLSASKIQDLTDMSNEILNSVDNDNDIYHIEVFSHNNEYSFCIFLKDEAYKKYVLEHKIHTLNKKRYKVEDIEQTIDYKNKISLINDYLKLVREGE